MGILFIGARDEVDHPLDIVIRNHRDRESDRAGKPFGGMGDLFDRPLARQLEDSLSPRTVFNFFSLISWSPRTRAAIHPLSVSKMSVFTRSFASTPRNRVTSSTVR